MKTKTISTTLSDGRILYGSRGDFYAQKQKEPKTMIKNTVTLHSRPLAVKLNNGKLFVRKLGKHIWIEEKLENLEPCVALEITGLLMVHKLQEVA